VNQICRERRIYHIHDEAYEYFTYAGVKHFSPGSTQDAADYTISLFSLSKAYGFASWRIGYMVVPQHLTQAVNKIQDTILICAPVISQFAAIGALKAGRNYCDEKIKAIAQVRNLVLRSLAGISNLCEVPSPQGAFYCFLRVRGDVDSMHLVRELVTQHRVAVIPGTAFGIQRGCYVRLAYGALTEATAAAGLNRFIKGMKETISAN
jgi:aspartate/methionine/tyrosine aminotransferase